jgi:uncharacterized membrane protein
MILPARMQFLMNRLRERLWVKPMIACVLSVAGVALAHLVDSIPIDWKVPEIAQGSIVDLLKVIAASMLGVATFAVASMVAAYASTGQSATERAFPLVIADDVSQNALSIFVGAFIFAIIGLSATTNDYFGKPGRFTLFVLTLLTLVIVVLVFVRWVDSIARLGRLGAVIARVERAAAEAMARRTRMPCMGGMVAYGPPAGLAFHSQASGYLQRVDMDALQRIAAERKLRITLAVAPGALIVCSRPIGYVLPDGQDAGTIEPDLIANSFTIGPLRQFDEDPGFGLVVLTDIVVLNAVYRIFDAWTHPDFGVEPDHDRVEVPPLSLDDMFNDIFPPLARDGAGVLEIALHLQWVCGELGRCGDPHLRAVAQRQADEALARSAAALDFAPDLAQLRRRHADYWGAA